MPEAPVLLNQIRWPEGAFVPPASDPALERRIKASTGSVSNLARHILPLPWLVDAMMANMTYAPRHVDGGLAQLIQLVVAQDNACRYCYGATRMFLKVMGYSEDLLRRLETDLLEAPFSGREREALAFARKLSRSNPRPSPEDLGALERAGWSRAAAAELAFLASTACFGNRIGTLLAVQPEGFESFAASPLGRLLRPAMAWMMSRRRPAWPVPPSAGGALPLARIFLGLEGFDAAPVIGLSISGAWGSSVLPRRAKALMLAVIARGISCPHCETGSRSLLEEEGLPPAEIEDALRHLSSSSLTPLERKLARFARETVRYQTPQIHDRCREAFTGLSRNEILEAVGIAGLANQLTRLSVLLS